MGMGCAIKTSPTPYLSDVDSGEEASSGLVDGGEWSVVAGKALVGCFVWAQGRDRDLPDDPDHGMTPP